MLRLQRRWGVMCGVGVWRAGGGRLRGREGRGPYTRLEIVVVGDGRLGMGGGKASKGQVDEGMVVKG